MFDKEKFAQILKRINDTYNNQRDFAKHSNINRTYLSQYMNMKLDEPPKPIILERLANNSNGLIDYNKLMEICGYIDDDYFLKLQHLKEHYETTEAYYLNKLSEFRMSRDEEQIYDDLINIISIYKLKDFSDIELDNELNSYFYNMDYVSNKSKQKIINKIKLFVEYYREIKKIRDNISNFEHNYKKSNELDTVKQKHIKRNHYYMCPVYGRIAAGEPNWAEECMEGKMPIDPELMNIINPEECYFLKVNGESMNKVIKNGAFALIRKTDWVENGEIAVVLVNGFDATLKKFTKQGELVILEPMSDNPNFTTQVYNKDTEIKIIGKYIGKMEMN